MVRDDVRPHTVEIMTIARREKNSSAETLSQFHHRPCISFQSRFYTLGSLVGWFFLLGLLTASTILQCYLVFAFLLDIQLFGLTIYLFHYPRLPRVLRASPASEYNRLVVGTAHMNSTSWTIYYGNSSLMHSLLNGQL